MQPEGEESKTTLLYAFGLAAADSVFHCRFMRHKTVTMSCETQGQSWLLYDVQHTRSRRCSAERTVGVPLQPEVDTFEKDRPSRAIPSLFELARLAWHTDGRPAWTSHHV